MKRLYVIPAGANVFVSRLVATQLKQEKNVVTSLATLVQATYRSTSLIEPDITAQ